MEHGVGVDRKVLLATASFAIIGGIEPLQAALLFRQLRAFVRLTCNLEKGAFRIQQIF